VPRLPRPGPVPCEERCPGRHGLDERAYAYLLGLYLGDGCLSLNGRTYRIRVLGVAARPANRINVSVARREAVARLDTFVGPKS
jgi:hypothetical protein